MFRTAIYYSLDEVINQFAITNEVRIYVDSVFEDEIVGFIRQNKTRFIPCLKFIFSPHKFIGTPMYKNGPECTKEIRFVGNAFYDGQEGLNSRIYTIKKTEGIILCKLTISKKGQKPDTNTVKVLQRLCKCDYKFDDTNNEQLIPFNDGLTRQT